jgi:hypothetical protein
VTVTVTVTVTQGSEDWKTACATDDTTRAIGMVCTGNFEVVYSSGEVENKSTVTVTVPVTVTVTVTVTEDATVTVTHATTQTHDSKKVR